MDYRHRNTGRFAKKSKAEWREKLSITAKRRKKSHEESTCEISGSRMFAVSVLAEELWCKGCDSPLTFRDVEKETKSGLASIFSIRCRQCLAIQEVSTSNFANNNPEDRRRRQYAVNIKAAAAVIDTGLGTSQLNNLLSEFDVPTIHNSTLRRHEVVVEKALNELADDSCQKAIHEEKHLILEENPGINRSSEEDQNQPVELIVSNDGAWSKRGNGFNYDSLSGKSDSS